MEFVLGLAVGAFIVVATLVAISGANRDGEG